MWTTRTSPLVEWVVAEFELVERAIKIGGELHAGLARAEAARSLSRRGDYSPFFSKRHSVGNTVGTPQARDDLPPKPLTASWPKRAS